MKRAWVVGLGVLVRDGMFEDEAEDVIVGECGWLLTRRDCNAFIGFGLGYDFRGGCVIRKKP